MEMLKAERSLYLQAKIIRLAKKDDIFSVIKIKTKLF